MPDTIVVPATGGMIGFTASCPFDSRVIVDYASAADGNGWLEIIDRSDAVVTKAGSSLSRTYKITVKADLALDPTQVNRGALYIVNGGNGSVMDTVTVYQGADIAYADTRFAAVTAYGAVWAPYNSGATEVVGKDETITVWTLEKCGYLYQWGRNVPFVYDGLSSALYTGDLSALNKYPNYNDACRNEGVYADKFITGFADAGNTWFKDYKTGGVTAGDNAWLRENQPCPVGWRVPTQAELEKILVDNPKVSDGKWVSPSNNSFILIAGGYWNFNGTSSTPVAEGDYWASSFTTSEGAASRLMLRSDCALVDIRTPAYAFSVRCVKNYPFPSPRGERVCVNLSYKAARPTFFDMVGD